MFHRIGIAGCVTALGLAIGAFPAAGRQDQQPPVFRGGVTFVNVDVYPRRDGHLVEGLRAQDFQVLEDGKPQNVEAFEFIRIAPNAPDIDRRDPNTKEEGDKLAADPRNRVFVFYLDLFHMAFGDPGRVRGPIVEFLGRTIGASDLFGVVTPRTPDPVRQLVLARRTGTLESDLARWAEEWIQITRATPLELQLANCTPLDPATRPEDFQIVRLYREELMATSLEDLMVHLRGIRDERKNLVLITEGWVPRPPAEGLLRFIQPTGPPRIGPTPGTGRLGIGSPEPGTIDRNWCNQQIGHLASIDFEQRFRNLLRLANQANVAFYPVDVGGLRVVSPVTGSVNTLRTLAENTDGRAVVNTNDLTAGLRRIADDVAAYYLLGYSSSNQSLDGKYREIKVKVNQPGVVVTARWGYLAPSAEAVRATATAASKAALPTTVANELARLSRLPSDAELFSYGVRSPTGLDVVAEISSPEMARGSWTNGGDVRVVVSRSSSADITATGKIEPSARATLVHLPLSPNDAGPWPVSVRVSFAAAMLTNRIEVPVPASTALVGEPVVFRGTASSRVALRPVADFQFRRNERLHIEWPALKSLDQRTARVLDRRGLPLPLSASVTESPGGQSDSTGAIVSADLNLSPLAEGDYLIELTVGQGSQIEHRLVAFRLVR